MWMVRIVAQTICSLHGDRKRLRTLATTGVGVSGYIRVGTYSQRNTVNLARSGFIPVGTGPAP